MLSDKLMLLSPMGSDGKEKFNHEGVLAVKRGAAVPGSDNGVDVKTPEQ